jgi:hypothetical protein
MGGTVTYDNANSAYINFASVRGYYSNKNNPETGDTIYNIPTYTSGNEFNGENRWIALARNSPTNGEIIVYQISTNGIIITTVIF